VTDIWTDSRGSASNISLLQELRLGLFPLVVASSVENDTLLLLKERGIVYYAERGVLLMRFGSEDGHVCRPEVKGIG
jgi:hypothetical protein